MAHVRFAALLAVLLATLGLTSLSHLRGSGSSNLAETAPKAAPPIPLVFEENRGQAGPAARFVARVPGGTVLLSRAETVVKVHRPKSGQGASGGRTGVSAAIRMRLAGSQPGEVLGEGLLPGKTHYLRGSDPKKWRRNVPLFERVRCPAVYPGVDLVYHTSAAPQLEYDFVVAPGADPGPICFTVAGAQRVSLAASGDLVLHTSAGELRQQKPLCYQERDGMRVPVSGAFVLKSGPPSGSPLDSRQPPADYCVSFRLGDYDPGRPLIIDPILTYSTYLGGNDFDAGSDIAAATDGTVYVVGSTRSTNFPTKSAFQEDQPLGDVFVAHLDPAKSGADSLLYATFLGGGGGEFGLGVAVDAAGNAYVAGSTSSADFPTTPQAFQGDQPGEDAFFTRLDSTGSALLYSTYLGGSNSDSGVSVALDAAGKAYMACTTQSPDFPIKTAFQTDRPGQDAALTKIDPLQSGAASVVFSTYLGGSGNDTATGIAVDGPGRAHVSGFTTSTDFPVSAGGLLIAAPSIENGFATKFGISGVVLYSTYLGGSSGGRCTDVAVDGAGRMFVLGETNSLDFPVTATAFAGTKSGPAGLPDAFLTKLNPALTGAASLVYSTYLGGSSIDFANHVAVDAAGNAYVTGETKSADFPTTSQTFPPGGSTDGFVSRLDPSRSGLSSLRFSTYLGGDAFDETIGVAVDAAGNINLLGRKLSTNFPTLSAFQSALGGENDAFVTRVAPNLPKAPLNLRVTTLSASQLKLTWLDSSNNETGFEIQRKSGTGSFAFLALASPNATTFTDSGVPATAFTYRVRAVNEEGESAFSNEATGAAVPPTAPGNLTAVAFGHFVALNWTDSVGEDTYQIERRRNSDGVFLPIATLGANTTTFAETGLILNRTFVYRVRAVNVLGATNSNEATATTLAAPTGLTVTNRAGSATQLRLEWVDNSGSFETGFRIQQKSLTSNNFNNVGEVGANVTAFTHTGLAPATQFTYRVFAFNGSSQSFFSNNASGSTAPIPKAPDQLTARALSGTQVRLKWRDNSVFEVGFRIERAEDGGKFTEAGSVGKEGTEFLDGGLSPRTSYTYRVAAFNDGGDSPFSNEAEVRTTAGPRGRLEVPDGVRFPSTAVGSQTTAFLRLRNRSRRESLLVIAEQPFAPFGASPPLRVKIGPGGVRLLRLTFRPGTAGAAEGVLRLHSSDPRHAEVFVRLVGEGAPP